MIAFDSHARRLPEFSLLFTQNYTDKYTWSGDTIFAYPVSCVTGASILGLETAHVELILIRNLFLIRRPAKRSFPKIPFNRRFLSALFRAPNSCGIGCPQPHDFGQRG